MVLGMLFLALVALPVAVRAWTFNLASFPTQCTSLTINWEGGEPPHTFSFLGLAGIGTNFSSWGTGSAVQNNGDADDGGGHNITVVQTSWDVPFAAGTPFVVIGSDNTGFGTGGTSDVYMVQPNPTGYDKCIPANNGTSLSTDIPIWGTTLPYQCWPMFDLLSNVTYPVQTAVVIPGGESFLVENTIYPNGTGKVGPAAQAWNMTVPAGTEVAFWVQDANGPVLVSGLQTVQPQPSNDTCLPDQTVYSSTAAPAAGALNTSPPSSASALGGPNAAGKIAGLVVGVVVGFILIVALVMFLIRRHNREKRLLKRQSIALATYAASQPSRLEGESWSKRGAAVGEL